MDPKPLNRAQLAKICNNDPEAIRLFERLFQVAGKLTPEQIAALQVLIDGVSLRSMVAQNTAGRTPNNARLDYLDFGHGPKVEAERRAWWGDDGTLDIGLAGGSVLQVGQETMVFAKNVSGATVADGSAVMLAGAVGSSGRLEFDLAVSDGSVSHDYMLGIATQNITNNQAGFVTTFGTVRGINTTGASKTVPETWADGDLLYFDPAYPGELTTTRPTPPSFTAPVAVVTHAGAGGPGSIFVRMNTAEALPDSFETVAANLDASGAVLAYSGGDLATITYANGVVKTFAYGPDGLASVTLSGNVPAGIDLTKELTYTAGNLSGFTYS